jgi:hypothetical protein
VVSGFGALPLRQRDRATHVLPHLRPGGRRGLLPAGTADAVFRTDSSLALVRFHVVHKNRYITGLKNPMAAF